MKRSNMHHHGTLDSCGAQPLCAELQELIQQVKQCNKRKALRLQQLSEKVGQANSTIWKYVKDGLLPPPIQLGARSVGWLESEIDAVISARLFATRSGKPVDIKQFVAQLVEASTMPTTSKFAEV
jgi:predicted DNA-binding transcriptional regulator AlpA